MVSKACYRLELLNLRILLFFSLKQDFVWYKLSFKEMLNGLPWSPQTKVIRVLSTILSDFLAKSGLQKAFKNFINLKATYQSPYYSDEFHVFQDMILLSILATSNSAYNLFKLFKVSVAFQLSVLRTGWEIIILHLGSLILIYDISDLIFFSITFDESLTVLLVPICSINADDFFLTNTSSYKVTKHIFY